MVCAIAQLAPILSSHVPAHLEIAYQVNAAEFFDPAGVGRWPTGPYRQFRAFCEMVSYRALERPDIRRYA
jgi:hypothetical protein